MVIMYYNDDNYNDDYDDDDDILQGEAGSEKLAQWWQGGNKPWLQVRLVKIVRLLLFYEDCHDHDNHDHDHALWLQLLWTQDCQDYN